MAGDVVEFISNLMDDFEMIFFLSEKKCIPDFGQGMFYKIVL